MNSRTLLALVLVATLLVPGVAMAAVLGSPELSTHLADNRVTPGERTTLGVVVQNSGDLDNGGAAALNSEVTTARGVTVRLKSGNAPVTVETGTQAIGSVPEGATPPVNYQVEIDENAEPGTYRLPVRVHYDWTSYISETDGTRRTNSTTETHYVTLRVKDEARFEIVDVHSDARVGETGTVTLGVKNVGTEVANDADVAVTAANPATTFGQTASATRFVDEWAPGERRNLTYSLTTAPDADTASYSFDLTTTYENDAGQRASSEPVNFGVTPLPEQSFEMRGVESTLRVGDDGQLRGEIVNTANTTVDGVVLEWVSQQQNVAPAETEYAVGSLGPGESATVNYKVEISEGAESGPRQFTFVADYRDAEGDPQRSEELDVQATVAPERDEFDVAVVNASLVAGDAGTVKLELTNAGNETLSDISAQVFASSPISTTDSEAFVASLEPGESTTLTFGVAAGSGALEKQYPLSMDFQYEEPDGDSVISETYRFAVDVSEPEESGGSMLPLVVVGLVIVALGAGFLRYYR